MTIFFKDMLANNCGFLGGHVTMFFSVAGFSFYLALQVILLRHFSPVAVCFTPFFPICNIDFVGGRNVLKFDSFQGVLLFCDFGMITIVD